MPCLILIFLGNKTARQGSRFVSPVLSLSPLTHDSNGKFHFIVIIYETNTKTENIWAADPVEIVFILFYFLDCLDLKCVPS